MFIDVQVPVNAPREKIWKIITDIENASDHISGIEEVEVLHRPENSLIGFKWKETRTLFGKKATETMWITEAEENDHYNTRAESHGSIYTSTVEINEIDGQNYVGMRFDAKPQSSGARIMSFVLAPLFKSATRKALMKDLQDIKRKAEEE